MSKEVINQTMTLEIPEGFHVMDSRELEQAFRSGDPNRWGIWNKESHVMVTILWKKYPLLLSMLADLKAVCRKNEQMARQGYAGHDYQCGGFFSLYVADEPAEGYAFSYKMGDVSQSAETVLFKKNRMIYSIICGGRTENQAADHEWFAGFLNGISEVDE